MSDSSIVRMMPNKWDYNRKRRTARRMRAKGYSKKAIRDLVWGRWR